MTATGKQADFRQLTEPHLRPRCWLSFPSNRPLSCWPHHPKPNVSFRYRNQDAREVVFHVGGLASRLYSRTLHDDASWWFLSLGGCRYFGKPLKERGPQVTPSMSLTASLLLFNLPWSIMFSALNSSISDTILITDFGLRSSQRRPAMTHLTK